MDFYVDYGFASSIYDDWFWKIFMKKAPKKINSVFGYRSSMSMKNKDTLHRMNGRVIALQIPVYRVKKYK